MQPRNVIFSELHYKSKIQYLGHTVQNIKHIFVAGQTVLIKKRNLNLLADQPKSKLLTHLKHSLAVVNSKCNISHSVTMVLKVLPHLCSNIPKKKRTGKRIKAHTEDQAYTVHGRCILRYPPFQVPLYEN